MIEQLAPDVLKITTKQTNNSTQIAVKFICQALSLKFSKDNMSDKLTIRYQKRSTEQQAFVAHQ